MGKTTEFSFQRHEKKYLLNEQGYELLMERLDGRMRADEYGRHTICNIYLDTDDYSLIRESIEKPVYKEKLRVRSYGVPKRNGTVFVEIKKKFKGVVYKRRESLTHDEAHDFLTEGIRPEKDSQILREIDWFVRCHGFPKPKLFLAYDREATFCAETPELRITFDRDIRWRASCLDLTRGDWGEPLLEPESVLMEIKIPGTTPLWLARTLSDLEIFPVSFSKYGAVYKENLINNFTGKEAAAICLTA